ncbi:MAG: hypothetical protein RLY97_1470 [Pseudomonadota bacterium]|jgi:hypothetical protein
MVLFENRSAAGVFAREHRKRKKVPFAAQHGANIMQSFDKIVFRQRHGHANAGLLGDRVAPY